MTQWRLTALCGEELGHLGQLDGQTALGHHVGHALLIVYGERLAPVALAAEDGIAQAVVHLHVAEALLLDIFLGACDSLLHGQAVEHEVTLALLLGARRVHHDTLLGIEALFRYVGTLDERTYLEAEMLGKGIVAAVVGRHCHDGSCAVACEYIVGNPYGDAFSGEGVDGIRTAPYTCHAAVSDTLTLGTLLCSVEVGLHGLFLLGCGEGSHQFALGSQHHEGDAKHRVGTGGEDDKLHIAVLHLEGELSTLAAAYPVALGLFERVGPVDAVESFEQSACVCRYAQAPLAHLLLHHGVSATL